MQVLKYYEGSLVLAGYFSTHEVNFVLGSWNLSRMAHVKKVTVQLVEEWTLSLLISTRTSNLAW